MDVLELPRPVINFLRTMVKESCRYVLSWDIFGGADTVTLTLTWKLTEDESQSSISKSSPQQQQQQQQVNDDLSIRSKKESISSPRHSRRDDNSSTSSVLRASRGKSLEGNNPTANKQIVSASQKQVSSLERSPTTSQQPRESDPIYANLCYVKYPTTPSSSTSVNKNPPLSTAHAHYRQANQQYDVPVLRKPKTSIPLLNNMLSKLTRTSYVATSNHDDDTPDPWVKRFESLLENTTTQPAEQSKNTSDETIMTSGKVKFKQKPDYF